MPKLVFTPELEEIILARLASGEALNAICNDPDIAVRESTVRYKVVNDAEFAARYRSARDIGYDCRAEQAVQDARTAEDAQKGRLAFEAERWYLGKMRPRTYGERIDVTSGGQPLPAPSVLHIDAKIQAIMTAAAGRRVTELEDMREQPASGEGEQRENETNQPPEGE